METLNCLSCGVRLSVAVVQWSDSLSGGFFLRWDQCILRVKDQQKIMIAFHISSLMGKHLCRRRSACGSSPCLSWLKLVSPENPSECRSSSATPPLRLQHHVCHAGLDAPITSVMETIANPRQSTESSLGAQPLLVLRRWLFIFASKPYGWSTDG